MGYDFTNPKRFHAEPLMRYIWTSMVLSFIPLIILAIITVTIFNSDGGKWLTENNIGNIYLTINIPFTLITLTLYTVLYYLRGWNSKEKWGIVT